VILFYLTVSAPVQANPVEATAFQPLLGSPRIRCGDDDAVYCGRLVQGAETSDRYHKVALLTTGLRRLGRRLLPRDARRFLVRVSRWPRVGMARGRLVHGLTPVSRIWGGDRGTPIDRYYIERFLTDRASDVRGRVLEISNNHYTRRYGGQRVERSDVLEKVEGNPKANIVADLTDADHLPNDVYDCILCTQTLQFIYDTRAALATLCRILKPGGALLVTVPVVSQLSRNDVERWGDYWRFTSMSVRLLLGEVFPPEHVTVQAHGNVLVATAFLYGLATEELVRDELDYDDPEYEFLITVRATKPGHAQ
jgi:SAM-dependent methyltransferase